MKIIIPAPDAMDFMDQFTSHPLKSPRDKLNKIRLSPQIGKGSFVMRVIGIAGYKGSGKSTVSNFFVQNYGCHRLAFADPIKKMLSALGLSDQQLYGENKEEPTPLLDGHTARYAMQTLGTEWGRMMIGPKVWINAWKYHADKIWQRHPTAAIVVDDVRFCDEADFIRSHGGVVIKVVRPGCASSDHASESQIEDLNSDALIMNTGSVFDLRQAVDQKVAVLREGFTNARRLADQR